MNVPDNLLPGIKASYQFYSQENSEELRELLSKRTVQGSARLDPTFKNFVAALDAFIAVAKDHPEREYLQILVFSGHGYHAFGFQEVLGPFFDNETKTYEYIAVEKYIRDRLRNLPNAYCLCHFATCREIKKMSDAEIDKLKEELDEKRAKELAE